MTCLLLVACGRVGFDGPVTPDAAPDGDTGPADLLVVYPMDSANADGVVGSSFFAYDGACLAAECPAVVPGKLGGAYAFDDSTAIWLPPALAGHLGTAPFTVAVWAAAVTTTSHSVLLAKPYSTVSDTDVASLFLPGGIGLPTFETTPDGKDYAYVEAPADVDIADGSWHHLAISWDGSTKRLYLDGALVGIAAATLLTANEIVLIGADLDLGDVVHHFHGKLDDLRIYTRALRDPEITRLATAR